MYVGPTSTLTQSPEGTPSPVGQGVQVRKQGIALLSEHRRGSVHGRAGAGYCEVFTVRRNSHANAVQHVKHRESVGGSKHYNCT